MTPEPCPNRGRHAGMNGTICKVTFDVLPAGPCPENCEHRPARTA